MFILLQAKKFLKCDWLRQSTLKHLHGNLHGLVLISQTMVERFPECDGKELQEQINVQKMLTLEIVQKRGSLFGQTGGKAKDLILMLRATALKNLTRNWRSFSLKCVVA